MFYYIYYILDIYRVDVHIIKANYTIAYLSYLIALT